MFPLGKINSYKPILSDVSDDDLMETVIQIKKSENVIAPTPGPSRTTPFDVFKTTRGRRSCSTRKSVKSPNIFQFNPIRSTAAMTELSKKRRVSPISAVLMFWFATPQKLFLLSGSNYQRNNFLLIFQHPGLFKSQDQMGCWCIQQVEGLQVRNFPSKVHHKGHPLQQGN